MPKTCNAFNWILYTVIASFIAWGVWFEAIQMNLFDTNPTPIVVQPAKKVSDKVDEKPTIRRPVKFTGKEFSDEMKSCVLTRYEGYAIMKAWYEESDAYGEKMKLLRIAEDDRFMLPEKVREWADGTLIESFLPDSVPEPLHKMLLKASAEKPVKVSIVELKVYCEGFPSVKLEKP